MGLFTIKRPEVDVFGGEKSRWSAVHNPVTYKLQRQDFTIAGVQVLNPGGLNDFITVLVPGLPGIIASSGLTVGSEIYISSGIYDFSGQVGGFPSNNTFTILVDVNASLNTVGGFINLLSDRDNYRIEVRILEIVDNSYKTIATEVAYKVDEKGFVDIDVRKWLQTLPRMINDFQYDVINKAATDLGGDYSISFRELFKLNLLDIEFIGSFFEPNDNNINFFLNAARQIQAKNSGNMAQFVMVNGDAPEEDKALFLSGFTEPSRFPGFPFDLQFIYSDNVREIQLSRADSERDINDSQIASGTSPLGQNEFNNVNRLLIPEDDVQDEIETHQVWIQTGFVVKPTDYHEPGYVDAGYSQDDAQQPVFPPTKG